MSKKFNTLVNLMLSAKLGQCSVELDNGTVLGLSLVISKAQKSGLKLVPPKQSLSSIGQFAIIKIHSSLGLRGINQNKCIIPCWSSTRFHLCCTPLTMNFNNWELVLLTSQYTNPVSSATIRNLSNNDGNGNESSKKAIGLERQNNNSAGASRFFVHFFAVVTRLQLETS